MVAATVTAWAITPLAPPLDDAYIVVHSGDVLRRGVDAAYGVPALTGITSPAFLAVVVAAHLMATAGLAALRWAIVVGVIAYFLGVWRLAGVAGAAGARRWLVVAAGLAAGTIGINLVNGLETGYACAALVWCFTGVLERRPLLAAAAAGIVPALRPDLTPVAAALAVAAAWQEGRSGWRVAALASAVALPFYVWIRVDTGAWWPATMDAKRLFFAEGCLSAEVKARTALRHLLDWAAVTAPIAAGALVAMRERLGLIAAAAAAVVIGVYAWSLPGALAHNEMRYLVPLLTPIGLYRLRSARVEGRRRGAGRGRVPHRDRRHRNADVCRRPPIGCAGAAADRRVGGGEPAGGRARARPRCRSDLDGRAHTRRRPGRPQDAGEHRRAPALDVAVVRRRARPRRR